MFCKGNKVIEFLINFLTTLFVNRDIPYNFK
nr:MAG TPA: hypothetical protein [Caudoviricetes sp.]